MTIKLIQKAGAIILSKDDQSKIALLYSGKQKDWSFPKGHIEDGEDPTNAMIREVKEETGLLVEILCDLPDINYTHPNGNNISIKMFLVQSEDDTLLRPEFKGDDIKWVPTNEVSSVLSYNNLKEYIKEIYHLIKK
ncbi:MAG: NUDIX domain-containing protein [Parcubacteria group bacterium]|nr:NUDIX domain-containing protein [Parcubacteria group bacterium]MCR4342313.1 NUDIX domain-containing protein [Patescibacteria group bacterium]